MADVQPFRALHYDRDAVGGLQAVAAPPYDVIDDEQRAGLVARSPYNVVEIDLPRAAGDPYAHAAEVFAAWMRSPGHRANILRRGFREIGIGIVARAPVAAAVRGATYTTDFGARS